MGEAVVETLSNVAVFNARSRPNHLRALKNLEEKLAGVEKAATRS